MMERCTKYLALTVTLVLICQGIASGDVNPVINSVDSDCDFYTVAFGVLDCLQHFKGLSENTAQDEQCSSIQKYMTCMEKAVSSCSQRKMRNWKIDVPWEELKSLKICQPQLNSSAQ